MKASQKSLRIAALLAAILIGINCTAQGEMWLAYAKKSGTYLWSNTNEVSILRLEDNRFPVLRIKTAHNDHFPVDSVWMYQDDSLVCVSETTLTFASGYSVDTLVTQQYYIVHTYGNGSNYGAPNAYGGWEEWIFYSVVDGNWAKHYRFCQYHESDVPQDAWNQFFASDAYASGCEWEYNDVPVYFDQPSLRFTLSQFSENGGSMQIVTAAEYAATLNALVP